MRSHAMTPKIHVSRLRHALMKLMQATTTSTDPYVLDAHKTAREVPESLNGTQQTLSPIYKSDDLSPTGRRPSQPELQHLPRAPGVTPERAKELLDQYRDTFPPSYGFRNFPCRAIDLASGVDYSVEQHPIQADHASVDDKGNVTWSGIRRGVFSSKGPSQNLPKWKPAQDKTPRRTHANPALAAPYGKPWSQLTADDIYKDISGMLLRQQADEEYNRRAVENGLQQEWVHLLDGRVSSYVPADQAGDAVFSTGRFEDGNMFVETMGKGEKAVTLARAYLLRLVNLEPK